MQLGPYKVKCMLAEPKTKRNRLDAGPPGLFPHTVSAGSDSAVSFRDNQQSVPAPVAALRMIPHTGIAVASSCVFTPCLVLVCLTRASWTT